MKFRVALLAAVLLFASRPAVSQGCAMCYSNAAGSTQQGQKAISKGVMVLFFPPLGFMTLGVWMAFRYGRKRDLEQAKELSFALFHHRADAGSRPKAELTLHLN